MEGAGFKSLIVFLLLAVLAFIAGSLAADSAASALVPSVCIAGVFLLLYLGKNAWALVFIVPSVLSVLNFDVLQKVPVGQLMGGVVLVYLLLLATMGHIRLKWNSISYFDVALLIFYIYFFYGWVRNPVTLRQFTSITDYGYDQQLGGTCYIWGVASVFPILAVSVLEQKLDKLLFVLKIAFWITILVSIFSVFRSYGELVSSGEEKTGFGESRVGVFYVVGRNIITFLLCQSSFFGVLLSPWKLAIALVACAGIMWSGFRLQLLLLACNVIWVAYFTRQLLWLFLLLLFSWGAVVYLSYQVDFDELPPTVRRVATMIPGVKVNKNKVGDAYGSIDWRLKMWALAADPSSGYIKDYTWGDGFAYSLYRERIRVTADAFGLIDLKGDYRYYAATGGWHSGVIEMIHRTGFVGLTLVLWLCIATLCMTYTVCKYMPKVKNRTYGLFYCVSIVSGIAYTLVERGYTELFNSVLFNAAITKMLYCSLRREGYFITVKGRKYYVPLLMQEETSPAAAMQETNKALSAKINA
ncbi:MAG: hypothetical protein E7031_02600 [Akkermansiaceae bacterium]|nr:hypothetical protein [Akkermansiaceae bacterium]